MPSFNQATPSTLSVYSNSQASHPQCVGRPEIPSALFRFDVKEIKLRGTCRHRYQDSTDKGRPLCFSIQISGFLRCFLWVVIGINSQQPGFVRRLKGRPSPFSSPRNDLTMSGANVTSNANVAMVLPQCVLICVCMSMRLSRLPCRGAGYGVVVGIGLFFSVFMLGLTWIQVSLSPQADRTGR